MNNNKEQWSKDYWGNTILTVTPSPDRFVYRPPLYNGKKPDFVGVHGRKFTRWTYYKKNQ